MLDELGHRGREALPLGVRLRPAQQQEDLAVAVPDGVQQQLRTLERGVVVVVVDHGRTPGPVVDQLVGVEDGHGLVRQRAQQVVGDQPGRRTGVHEPVSACTSTGPGRARGPAPGRRACTGFEGRARGPPVGGDAAAAVAVPVNVGGARNHPARRGRRRRCRGWAPGAQCWASSSRAATGSGRPSRPSRSRRGWPPADRCAGARSCWPWWCRRSSAPRAGVVRLLLKA